MRFRDVIAHAAYWVGEATTPRNGVYIDPDDWWIGYYRGKDHRYVCPLPTLVIRWRRRTGDAPTWSDGDPWRDWTLVVQDGYRWAVNSRLARTDRILHIDPRPPEQVFGTITSHVAVIDSLDYQGRRGYRMERQTIPLPGKGTRWGPYPPHYVRGFDPEPER